MGERVRFQTSGPDCGTHRGVRTTTERRAGPSAQRDRARGCHLAAVSTRGLTVAQSARQCRAGQWLDTLRRFLAYRAENAVLAKVHALLVAMLRGNPILILDSCSVRAKRGGRNANNAVAVGGRSNAPHQLWLSLHPF